MTSVQNLENEKINRWSVLGFDARRQSYLICECECDNVASVYISKLTSGYSKSCGCMRKDRASSINSNLVGERFGRLLIIEDSGKRQNRKIVWKCLCDCGNIVYKPTTYLTTGDTQSCGCFRIDNSSKMMRALSLRNIGENHYNWDGGKASKNSVVRGSGEYSRWRMSIFYRDEFRCQICGVENSYLNAHHIYGFSEYIDLRFDLNNGISMCEDCHKNFHARYGRRNFGEIELMDFIERQNNGSF